MLQQNRRKSLRWVTFMLVMGLLISVLGQSSATKAQPPDCAYGNIPLNEETYQQYLKPVEFPEGMSRALPTTYDARDDGIVTPAKNQASCGSCWAFANAGAMESHLLKEGLPFSPTDLSEQQLISCDTSQLGCCGGYITSLRFWETIGPVYDTCFPYGDGATVCPPTQSVVPCSNGASCPQLSYRLENFHTVASDQFKQSLYVDGPSVWTFLVYDDFYNYYTTASSGSVYVNGSGSTYAGGHAVLLIGWDDNKGAYLAKNSWGATSGPQGDGTFWIAYSGHNHDLGFAMANFDVKTINLSHNNYLPLVLKPGGVSTLLANGDFELGQVSWTEYSYWGWDLITQYFPEGFLPRSGSWAVWLGGDYDETAQLSQSISIPASQPYLHYWYWIASEDVCDYDYFRVKINGSTYQSYDLCSDNDTGGWVEGVYNLSPFAGTTVSLMFEVTTDEVLNSNLFLDDVSLSSSAAVSQPEGVIPGMDIDASSMKK